MFLRNLCINFYGLENTDFIHTYYKLIKESRSPQEITDQEQEENISLINFIDFLPSQETIISGLDKNHQIYIARITPDGDIVYRKTGNQFRKIGTELYLEPRNRAFSLLHAQPGEKDIDFLSDLRSLLLFEDDVAMRISSTVGEYKPNQYLETVFTFAGQYEGIDTSNVERVHMMCSLEPKTQLQFYPFFVSERKERVYPLTIQEQIPREQFMQHFITSNYFNQLVTDIKKRNEMADKKSEHAKQLVKEAYQTYK